MRGRGRGWRSKGHILNVLFKVPFCKIVRSNLQLGIILLRKKVKVGNDQEMAQSERNSHSTNRRVEKKPIKNDICMYLYQESIS